MAILLGLVLCLSAEARAESAGRSPDKILVQPATYLSHSGAWELFVNPSAPDARGSARYIMRHDGAVVWDTMKEFTLTDVALSDQGVTLGASQPPYRWKDWQDEAPLLVVILGSDGATQFRESHPRSRNHMYSVAPRIRWIHVQNELDRGVLHVITRSSSGMAPHRPARDEAWWTYDLSSSATERLLEIGAEFPFEQAPETKRLLMKSRWPMGKSVHTESPKTDLPPYLELEPILEVLLGIPSGTRPAIRDIVEFSIPADGIIEFLRREKGPVPFSSVRISTSGELLSETDVHGDEKSWRMDWPRFVKNRRFPTEYGNPGTPLFPTAVTLTANDKLVLLEETAKVLRVYKKNGEFLQVVRLNQVLTQDFESVDSIAAIPASAGGGVILTHSKRGTRHWHLDPDFALVEAFDLDVTPSRHLGTSTHQIRVDSSGAIWSTDGQSFTRHAPDGSAEIVLGASGKDPVYAIRECRYDAEKYWVLRDRRTSADHVFDDEGRPHAVERRAVNFSSRRLTASFAYFDGAAIRALGPSDSHPRQIPRRPDGWFWTNPSVGRDARGRVVAIERGQLFLYSAEGVLEQFFAVPGRAEDRTRVVFAGDWIVQCRRRAPLTLIRLRDEVAWRFVVPGSTEDEPREIAGVTLSPSGKELRLIVDDPPTLLHYELP